MPQLLVRESAPANLFRSPATRWGFANYRAGRNASGEPICTFRPVHPTGHSSAAHPLCDRRHHGQHRIGNHAPIATTLCLSGGMAQLMLNDTGQRLDRIGVVSYQVPAYCNTLRTFLAPLVVRSSKCVPHHNVIAPFFSKADSCPWEYFNS